MAEIRNMLFRALTIWLVLLCIATFTVLGQTKIERKAYKGWNDAIFVFNKEAKIVVVPSIGRVMQFGFAGDAEEEGVFWENEKLLGKSFSPDAKEWLNFGGDKVWAAPIADWRKQMNRRAEEPNFPPAPGFDGMPFEAKVKENVVELIGQIDPFYGIRVRRFIKLNGAKMRIETIFEKLAGDAPVKVSIWTVTQLKNPQKVFLLLPEKSIFERGFTKLSAETMPGIQREGRLLWLERDAQKSFKIGSDAPKMLWIGERATLEMFAPQIEAGEYPDNGSRVEIYTAPNPLGYVELETLGELRTLEKGDKMSLTNHYVLRRRSETSEKAEAEKLWRKK